jgi:2-polyprenyl-3-methyl-5-hydroxy-6-metoxy-1,4-benzoquinol methylase
MADVRRNEIYGFSQLDPIPTNDELKHFYESRYYHLIRQGGRAPELRKMMEGGDTARRELEWLKSGMYRDITDTLSVNISSNSLVLDVGAGTGEFVAFLNENGYLAEGIEPAHEPSEAARQRGLRIQTATLASWVSDNAHHDHYDSVVMLNVLEHVPNPEIVIEQSVKLLRKGGVLVIRVPNDFTEIQKVAQEALNRDAWWVCAPDHINYFNVESLRRFLEQFNLEVLTEMTDFPMELFLMMGEDYIGNANIGSAVHQKRCTMELAMPPSLRQKLYIALASVGIGRNVTTFARKRT